MGAINGSEGRKMRCGEETKFQRNRCRGDQGSKLVFLDKKLKKAGKCCVHLEEKIRKNHGHEQSKGIPTRNKI